MPNDESSVRRAVLFATAPPALSRDVIRAARARFPEVAWTVYYRATERAELIDVLDGVDARIDKPAGSKRAFLAAIRAERFDLAVVVWGGHRTYDRMKIVALCCGARARLVYVRPAESFYLDGFTLRGIRHARWYPQLSRGDHALVTTFAAWCYRWSIGWLVGWAGAWSAWWRAKARQRARTADRQGT